MRRSRWDSRIPARIIFTGLAILFSSAIAVQFLDLDSVSVSQYVQLHEVQLSQEDPEVTGRMWQTLPPHRVSAYQDEEPGEFLIRAYSDPTAHGEVPLSWVADRRNQRISSHLTFGDFAPRDGAAMARIDPQLVEALEAIIEQSSPSLRIISGYRHPSRNMHPAVNGSSHSQHMAGRAADIVHPEFSPLELADIALEQLGCSVGLGLGGQSLHLDVRGRLATWSYDGAELDRESFSEWAKSTHCPPPDTTIQQPEPVQLTLNDYVELLAPQIRLFYEDHLRWGSYGAVKLTIHSDNQSLSLDNYSLELIRPHSPRSRRYDVNQLIEANNRSADNIVYVATNSENEVIRGIMGARGY